MAKALGWTHPDHGLIAFLGTLCQVAAVTFALVGILGVSMFIQDRPEKDKKSFTFVETGITCEKDYCYNVDDKPPTPLPVHYMSAKADSSKEEKPAFLGAARILILIGIGSNGVSLLLLLLVFWPVVCTGKVLNYILQICRVLDFFGAPTKFIGCFILISSTPSINKGYMNWKYDDVYMLDPMPIGLALVSYILQTLCFVCNTIAVDRGATGGPSHMDRIKSEELAATGMEDAFKRVSYHPIDTARSSGVLQNVAHHFQEEEKGN